jgi:flagellar hook-length control protein FliK
MLAGVPVALQTPAATQLLQLTQPQPVGAGGAPLVLPQFDAAMATAMADAGRVGLAPTSAQQRDGTRPTASATATASAARPTTIASHGAESAKTPQSVQAAFLQPIGPAAILPAEGVPGAAASADRGSSPAIQPSSPILTGMPPALQTKGTRYADVADLQRPAQTVSSIGPAAILPAEGVPGAATSADRGSSPIAIALPTAALLTAMDGNAVAGVKSLADSLQQPLTVVRQAKRGGAVPDGSTPAGAATFVAATPNQPSEFIPSSLAMVPTDEGNAPRTDTAAAQEAASRQPALSPALAITATATPQALPQPRPESIAGAEPAARPAANATRRGEANDRQRPAQAAPQEPAEVATVDESIATAVERFAGSVQPLAVSLKSAGHRSAISDGAAPISHDAIDAVVAPLPAQFAPPTATETPASLLQTSAQQAAAIGTPASASPRPMGDPPPAEIAAPVPGSTTAIPNDAQRMATRHEPQQAGAEWVLPALSESDATPAKAMVDAAPANDAPAPPATALSQVLPLPAAAWNGTEPATRPAGVATRTEVVPDRQQAAQALPPSAAEPAITPPIQGAAPILSLIDPGTPPATVPNGRPRTTSSEYASAAARKPVGSVPMHVATASLAEPRSSAPTSPSPATRDVIGDAPIAPSSANSASPVAMEPSVQLQGSTQTSATAPGAPTELDSPRPTVASPAEQVAPVLVSMAHAQDGAQRLTLRLDPAGLGHVQIRIDRTLDAAARVDITVEKPETLLLLLRDQPQLQRALDQAGIPPDGRSVTFHIATPEAGPRYDGGQAPSGIGTGSPGTGDASHGASHQGGRPARGAFADTDDTKASFAHAAPKNWVRAGLDITA